MGDGKNDDALLAEPVPPTYDEQGAPDTMSKQQNMLLFYMFLFQFFHWFKPSEAFFADYVLPRYGVSRATLISDVYAWDTPFQILAAALMVVVFTLLGGRAALLLCAAAAIATVMIVLFLDSFTFLVVSQAVWALSFTALFVVPAVLYRLTPPAQFQTVSSLNNCAMLCASLSANLFSFVASSIAPEMVCGTSTASRYRIPFFVSLSSACTSLIVLAVGALAGWVPSGSISYSRTEFVAQMKANSNSHQLLLWLLVSAVTRGIHTQVVTLWPLVSLEIAPECTEQRYNSLISFVAYLGAACAVLLPAKYNKVTAEYGRFAVAPALLLCSLLLMALSVAQELWQLGILMLAYHSCSEFLLTIASARIAHAALAAGRASGGMDVQYMATMTAKYVGSLLVETVTMLVIWPRWGGLDNVFGLDLEVRAQIKALGVVLVVAFMFTAVISCREFARRANQCAHYEHV